jgi:hypothetical protein
MEQIFKFFLQCLRAIVRSSPSTSPSRPSDIREEIALFEERVEPKYLFEFEEVDLSSDELIELDD